MPDGYRPVTIPGVWIPTAPPLFPEYARAKPWVMQPVRRAPHRRPDLKSALYARDYNETRELGAAKSTKRTPEQTEAVKFWTQANWGLARRGAPAVGCEEPVARRERPALCPAQYGRRQHLHHRLGRQVHLQPLAARDGNPQRCQDGNDATLRDADWTSLNANPMFPEYPSQAAIVAGVSIGILEAVFGANPSTSVVATDDGSRRCSAASPTCSSSTRS